MLLIVIYDKESQAQKPGQNAANNPHDERDFYDSRNMGQGCEGSGGQHECRGKNAPPAFEVVVPGIRLGARMQRLR